MSAQTRRERDDYYRTLELTQKSGLDVTQWQIWFLDCLLRAIDGAQETLSAVLGKAKFWEHFAKEPLNERQIKVLNRLLDGFGGEARKVLTGYCLPGHSGSGRAKGIEEGSRRRTQYELFTPVPRHLIYGRSGKNSGRPINCWPIG